MVAEILFIDAVPRAAEPIDWMMSYVIVLGGIFSSWAFLRLLGGERDRQMVALCNEVSQEEEETSQPAPAAAEPSPLTPTRNPAFGKMPPQMIGWALIDPKSIRLHFPPPFLLFLV